MIWVEALRMSVAPLDKRIGMDTIITRLVQVFGEVCPHQAYLFAIRCGTLVCDDYSGYKALIARGVTEAGCMARARCKLF